MTYSPYTHIMRMIHPPLPADEAERLAALQSYAILDATCEDAFDNLAELAALLTGAPISAVSLVDANRQCFVSRYGLDLTETSRDLSFCAHAILDPSQPLIVPDARADPRFADNPLVTGDFGLRFYLGVPLVSRDHAVLGTLCIIDRVPRTVTALQLKAMIRLAEAVMTTLELRRTMAVLHQQARSDSLTGLANRAGLLAAVDTALARLRRHGGAACLVLLDLDGFKNVNDRLGHSAGDAMLRVVADCLRATLRGEDLAARLGGDEFALLLEVDAAGALSLAARFQENLAQAMLVQPYPVTASIGIAALQDKGTAKDALRQADAAMYWAKSAGKNQVASGAPNPVMLGLPAHSGPHSIGLLHSAYVRQRV